MNVNSKKENLNQEKKKETYGQLQNKRHFYLYYGVEVKTINEDLSSAGNKKGKDNSGVVRRCRVQEKALT